MKPKEGTILTVAKVTAEKAVACARETEDFNEFAEVVIKEANAILKKTPDMLPVLKEAGVVDSGGQGLVEVLKGAQDAFLGKEIDYTKTGLKYVWKVDDLAVTKPAQVANTISTPATTSADAGKQYKLYIYDESGDWSYTSATFTVSA